MQCEHLEPTHYFQNLQFLGSDGHLGFYPWAWLKSHEQSKVRHLRSLPKGQEPGPPRYNAHDISLTSINLTFDDRSLEFFRPGKQEYPEVQYEDVMAKDEAVLQWLNNIVSFPRRRSHIQLHQY